MGHLFVSLVLLVVGSASANAGYTRLWRGFQRTDLSVPAFVEGLNTGLLPATGRLRATSVGIRAYQPVILPRSLVERGLPAEVALLEYDNESGYQAYRATPEGKAYGDLHWEYFARETSGSQVPVRYAGQVELGKAYDVIQGERLPNSGEAYFRVYLRVAGVSEADYLASVAQHVDHVSRHSPSSLVVSVNADSILEYVIWKNDSDRVAADVTAVNRAGRGGALKVLDPLVEMTGTLEFQARLRTGRSISVGTGVRYRF